MARLNLNFCDTDYQEPGKMEIVEIECMTHNILAIVKMLQEYADSYTGRRDCNEMVNVVMSACNVLKLLMVPVIDYMVESAGKPCPPDKFTGLIPIEEVIPK